MKRVLFYSSVSSKSLFLTQRFYVIDMQILKELGCEVVLSNSIRDAFCFWRYDFVFAYFYRKSFFVALIAKFFFKNAYFTGGIDDLDENHASPKRYAIQKLFFRLCYWMSKSCIIVSESDKQNILKFFHRKNLKKLSYSEHTIDVCNFLRTTEVHKEKIFTTIVWMGNEGNVRRKGIDTALRVFSSLREQRQFCDYKFVIIGKTGEGTSYVRNLINEYGLQNAVTLTGEISEDEKIQLLLRSKYYFQLSIYEGFGLAALEALAAKDIVIHSGRGGLANPIFSSGIYFDISNDWGTEMDNLLNRLSTYDERQLESMSKHILQYYDNSRRKDDFLQIISELNN